MLNKIISLGIEIRTNKKISQVIFILLLGIINLSPSIAAKSNKQIIGWLEHVKINGNEFQLEAKIDTGATTSSLNATILKKFKRNGEKWIRFQVENKEGQEIILTRKISRYTRIKRKMAFSLKRPVVKLGLCLGNVYRELEVNLADRKNFSYQVLVGRNYLHGYFLVDSEIEFKTNPSCK